MTGSGKTEIYLKAIERALAMGKQAIVLVPEIALTPQTVRRLLSRFPGRVGLVHSKLSPGERYDTWRRARAGLIQVILGPRSALFTPLPNLGLIVVDECHEDSYYQDDTPPFYHAVDAALLYANLTKSVIVLGSATPSVEMVYQANQEGWERLELPNRIMAHRSVATGQLAALNKIPSSVSVDNDTMFMQLPKVEIADMREELNPETGQYSAAHCKPKFQGCSSAENRRSFFSTGADHRPTFSAGSAVIRCAARAATVR